MAYVFFPEDSLSDITTAFELFPGIKEQDPSGIWKVRGLRLSCSLQLVQVVMTSSDVVDIILNFTAVNFISSLDDLAFELADSGKYGPVIKEQAQKIKEENLPDSISQRSEHKQYKFGIAMICFLLYIMTMLVMVAQDNSNIWATPVVRVQFEDESRSAYSGCYHIERDNMTSRRYIYSSDIRNKNTNAKIGYCLGQRRWLFYKGDDPCDAFGKEDEIAHSTKTDTYEIESSIQEDWFSPFNTPLDDMYFVQADDLKETCGSFLGNSVCDQNLNIYEYQYDGGDCCAATCNGARCGKVDGDDTTSMFLFCADPSMTTFTIRVDEIDDLIESGDLLLSLDCNSNEAEYNVFLIDPGSDALLIQPAMVQQGFSCRLKAVMSNDTNQERDVSLKYSLHHGYNITGLQGSKDYSFSRRDEGEITTSFVVPAPLLNTDNKFIAGPHNGEMLMGFLQNLLSSIELSELTGTIPSEIGLLTTLTSLSLSHNAHKLTGTIPSEIGLLTSLKNIVLVVNELTGTIPSEIGLLTNLMSLVLGTNFLTGTIPSEIGLVKNLTHLDLDRNELTGTIPSEIGLLTTLTSLFLSHNELTGTIPSEIELLTNLMTLGLFVNQLTGTISSEIGLWTSLKNIYLDANELTGTIPSEIGLLTTLTSLSLSHNELTGTIPSEIGLLTNLMTLGLYIDELTGRVPSELLSVTSLTGVSLNPSMSVQVWGQFGGRR